jgi:RimJ/RimL family protein N-acetyltransferase
MKIPVLEGILVRLRPMNCERDIDEWYRVSQDEKMHMWIGNTVPTKKEEIERLLTEVYPKHFLIWMIEEKGTGDVIGMMRISYPESDNGVMIAGDSQRLNSNYWRKGYMKESRKLIYKYVFDKLEVGVLYADVWKGNVNSEKSLESVGYQFLYEEDAYFEKYDRIQSKRYYRLTRKYWLLNKGV